MNERSITDEEVLETVENCIEEQIGDRDLDLQFKEFNRCYQSWLNYHHEMTEDYRREYE
jgi:hypothetical protein